MEDLNKLDLSNKSLEELEQLRQEIQNECEELSKKFEENCARKKQEFSSNVKRTSEEINDYYYELFDELKDTIESSELILREIDRVVSECEKEISDLISEVKKI